MYVFPDTAEHSSTSTNYRRDPHLPSLCPARLLHSHAMHPRIPRSTHFRSSPLAWYLVDGREPSPYPSFFLLAPPTSHPSRRLPALLALLFLTCPAVASCSRQRHRTTRRTRTPRRANDDGPLHHFPIPIANVNALAATPTPKWIYHTHQRDILENLKGLKSEQQAHSPSCVQSHLFVCRLSAVGEETGAKFLYVFLQILTSIYSLEMHIARLWSALYPI
ncbi:hypothetical protein C8J57DRAFT_1511427 [Mycena rebaudengoi]|nr:hypothetical protein C8J57DRAFT_1511427 [Mycena rebaudengoi]